MGIFDTIKGQLRSVIEWENADPSTLFALWTDNGDEIKNCSKLIVKPGQGAIFVYEGRVQAVHLDEGLFELSTSNIPFITTLTKFMQSFESEHKVGIYFFWQTEFLNQKWGTKTVIKYNDPVYNFPVGMRAFGNYSFKISKPEQFFVNIVGARPEYKVDDFRVVARDRILQPMTDLFAEAGYSYAEIDKNRDELAAALKVKVHPEFDTLGFKMTDFRIESTSFDEETNERIGRIADISAEAIAAKRAGIDYSQLQQLEALKTAAANQGGAAGVGVGIGAGVGLGGAMAQSFNPGQQAAQPTAAATPQAAQPSVEERLGKLKSLFDKELIDEAEFKKRKGEILAEL